MNLGVTSGSFGGYEGNSEVIPLIPVDNEESGEFTSLNIVSADFKSFVVTGHRIYVRTPCGEWSPTGVDVSSRHH